MKQTYKIVLDTKQASLFHALPTVEANSPKQAAEQYACTKVTRHIDIRGGEIVVQTTTWPRKMYLYDRVDAK